MSYYQGDFYLAGDYARMRGDPGLFSFLGKAIKTGAGLLGLGGGATKVITVPIAKESPRIITRGREIIRAGAGAIMKHPVLSAAGGAAVGGAVLGAEKGKILRGAEHLLGIGGRRRRRMNPYNPRALRRALRRTHSFAKMAKKILRVSHMYKKPRGRFALGGYGRKRSRK